MSDTAHPDDAFAAEYALGTLDAGERDEAERRRGTDSAFDGAVLDWERRLAPLIGPIGAIDPPGRLRALILQRIGGSLPATHGGGAGAVFALRRQVRRWQVAAASAAAIAAALAVWVAREDSRPVAPGGTYLAVLQQGGNAPSFIVSVDLRQRTMTVVPSDTAETAGKSYELWMIDPEHPKPLSLGVVPAAMPIHPRLPQDDAAVISRATYAVTIEQQGGSPTGNPTSPPVFVGRLRDAQP